MSHVVILIGDYVNMFKNSQCFRYNYSISNFVHFKVQVFHAI